MLFFDPSIKPVVTTDINGDILYIRTYGLEYYGYSDIILTSNFDDYELIFYSIIDKIFNLTFKVEETWYLNDFFFKLEINEDGLYEIIFPEVEEVQILTITKPGSQQPTKYLTKGLRKLFNIPEIETDAATLHGKMMIAYCVDKIVNGEVIDEHTLISMENNEYHICKVQDRYGLKVMKLEQYINQSHIQFESKRCLRRIK